MNNPNRRLSGRDKNILTLAERIGEVVGIVIALLVAAFFAYHLTRETGFMTASFGLTGTVLMFGTFALSIVSAGARAIIGRKDLALPFELASSLYTAIAAFWFLVVFPFDFSHLADALPSYLRFVLSWISNSIGWFIILITALVSTGMTISATVRLILIGVRGGFK